MGGFITALQLALVFYLSPVHRPAETYANLCHWDCAWYSSIVREGYHSPVPPVAQKAEVSNVAFFPGFPILGRAAYLTLGIKPELVLVVIAQIFAVLFWAALWMTLRSWSISNKGSLLVMIATLAHPAIFFLIAGYSESLFLATLLLFILSSRLSLKDRAGEPSLLGTASGFMMSATRIVGIPVSIFPMLNGFSKTIFRRKPFSSKTFVRTALASFLASLGAVAFLVYCKIKYGIFDLYMETQRIGWGIVPDYGAILKWKEFAYTLDYDKVATIASGISFLAFAALEGILFVFKKNRGLTSRLPIYAVAFMIFFITLSGLKVLSFRSMIRYTLPWHVLLLLCLAHLISRNFKYSPRVLNACFVLSLIGAGIAIRLLGVPHVIDFLNSRWFA